MKNTFVRVCLLSLAISRIAATLTEPLFPDEEDRVVRLPWLLIKQIKLPERASREQLNMFPIIPSVVALSKLLTLYPNGRKISAISSKRIHKNTNKQVHDIGNDIQNNS